MQQVQFTPQQNAESWMAALVEINRGIADMDSIDNILALILDLARRLLDADGGALGMWNATGEQLDLKCYTPSNALIQPQGMHIELSWIVDAVRSGRSCLCPEDLPANWLCPVTGCEVRAAAITPLLLDGKAVGGLWLMRYEARPFSPQDLQGLKHLADQSVIALEHALMTSRLQSLAVTEERGRIAREMHDSVAQILSFLNIQMQTLEVFAKQGEQEKLLSEIKQARQRIKAAQADVRENILSLRTTLCGEIDLMAALRQYVDEFGFQTGLDAQLAVSVGDALHLSPLAETQLVRIIQEALTNVRKHARATLVQVSLAEQDSGLQATVTDDGVGMPVEVIGASHFGLQMMRERAESMGGTLTIRSWPDAGTQIDVWLPFVNE